MCRKQPPLIFTPYMEQCALSLREDSEVESDKTLLYFVQVLRIINEVYQVFEYGDPDHSLSMGDDKVQVVVRVLEGQLHTWRTNLPPELADHGRLPFLSYITLGYLTDQKSTTYHVGRSCRSICP